MEIEGNQIAPSNKKADTYMKIRGEEKGSGLDSTNPDLNTSQPVIEDSSPTKLDDVYSMGDEDDEED